MERLLRGTLVRDERIAAQLVLVALLLDLLLQRLLVDPSQCRIDEQPRASMEAIANREVLGRTIEHLEARISQTPMHVQKPLAVELAVIELLGQDGRVARDLGLLCSREVLADMRMKEPDARFQGVPAADLLREPGPLGREHRRLHEALIADAGGSQQHREARCRILRSGLTGLEQVDKHVSLRATAVSGKRVVAQRLE